MTFKQEVQLLVLLSIALLLAISFMHIGKNPEDSEYIAGYRFERDSKKLQKIVTGTTAEGVIVYDASSQKVIASKGIDKKYSLASLTKIITATIVYEKDRSKLNEIRDMLKTSNNEEAQRLAFAYGADEQSQAEYMNAFTARFKDFYFRNVSGLDIQADAESPKLPGGEGRPLALASFIREYYFKYPELFDQTIMPQNNTNVIVNQLSFLNGGKTGYTDLSGGNLFVSIQKGLDRQIFIIVLNSTEKNRFVDVQQIAHFLLQSSI